MMPAESEMRMMDRRSFIASIAAFTGAPAVALGEAGQCIHERTAPIGGFRVDFIHSGRAMDSIPDAECWLRASYPGRDFYSAGRGIFVYPIAAIGHEADARRGNRSTAFVLAKSWNEDFYQWLASIPPHRLTPKGGVVGSAEWNAMYPWFPGFTFPNSPFLVVPLGSPSQRP